MANQQRSVIVTAIVLAIILGGVLVWLLNRTPADQLATTAPEVTAMPEQAAQTQSTPTEIPVEDVQGVAATAPTGAGMAGLAVATGLGGLGMISLAFFGRFRR